MPNIILINTTQINPYTDLKQNLTNSTDCEIFEKNIIDCHTIISLVLISSFIVLFIICFNICGCIMKKNPRITPLPE